MKSNDRILKGTIFYKKFIYKTYELRAQRNSKLSSGNYIYTFTIRKNN